MPFGDVTKFRAKPCEREENAWVLGWSRILDIQVSKWSRNPFVQRAWTDPAVCTIKGHYKNMAGRLKNFFFAGEGTSSEWHGYVQGAYFTGRDNANEIVSRIRGGKL